MSGRTYPNYPQHSSTSNYPTTGQPVQNFPGQSLQSVPGYSNQHVGIGGHLQNQYPGQGVGGQNVVRPSAGSAPPSGQVVQNYYGQPGQNVSGIPPSTSLASRVQQMKLGPQAPPSAPQQFPGPPSMSRPPPSLQQPQLHQGLPPRSQPPSVPPPTIGGAPSLNTGPLSKVGVQQMPGTGHPIGQPVPVMTSSNLPPPPLPGQTYQPPPTTQQSLPPPPTSGQGAMITLGQNKQLFSTILPPPPSTSTGQPSQALMGQGLAPPPTSVQANQPLVMQGLPPPPSSGQSLLGQGMQPAPPSTETSGQYSLGQTLPPPHTSGQTYQPSVGQGLPQPPSMGQPSIGQGLPPPPSMGQPSMGQGLPPPPSMGQPSMGQGLPLPPSMGQPSMGQGLPPPPSMGQPTVGQGLPPPPLPGQTYQHSSVQGPPPPPTSGQSSLGQGAPPTSTVGQPRRAYPPAPVGLSTGPVTGKQQPPPGPGQIPPGPGQIAPGPGQLPPGSQGQVTPGAPPGGVEMSDPYLRPVNVLECRNVLPTTPIVPPPAVLPANMSRFNANHKVFCSTMNAVPATSGILSKLKLPFAVHIHPYKDMPHNECPVVHPNIIIRCRMCRAYINPFVTFIDSRHWRCNLCYRPNTLPEDFDYNPHSGRHGDRSHRIELKRSSVEYIAPSEYMVRPPQPCVYYFVIDVSFNAIETGLLGVFCRTLLDNLERLPGDARTMVGILTFDSSLHFYNLSSSLSQPQMLVVSDVDDVFLPTPDSLLASLKDSKELIRNLLEDLPKMFANNRCTKSALGAALQAATKLLTPVGGRITVLQSSLPNIGPGALKYREVVPSSTKMNSLNMAPASDFYKKLALDCSSQQIAVDLFAFCGQFIDLVTMACISKFSSGQVFYYPDFHHMKTAPKMKFEKDFRRYLTRKIGFEAVMRIRCTDGLSLHTFHGNFFVRSTDLLSLPNVNPDHGYTMNISIDENLKEVSTVCFQAALLYTSSRGERRIRVHTLSLPVTNQLAHIYARLNVQAITGVLANMAIDRASSSNIGDAREALMNTVIDATKMYRSQFASSMQASQFNLPGSLQLLPLFIVALLKSPAFSLNSKVSFDFRTQAMNLIKSLPLDYLMCLVYPRLYALHMLTEKDVVEQENGTQLVAPPILQLSAEKMTRYGIFLMDYGMGMYIWVSKDAPQELVQKFFGFAHFGAIPETMLSVPTLENESSTLVNKLVQQIRSSRQHWMPLQVIREDGPHRLLFIDKLVEDRTDYGTSYYELLTHIGRQIK